MGEGFVICNDFFFFSLPSYPFPFPPPHPFISPFPCPGACVIKINLLFLGL